MKTFHKSVLLNEVINYLAVSQGKKYIDATVGGAGHTQEILKRGGLVLGIDQDQEALDYIRTHLPSQYKDTAVFVKGNFENIEKIAQKKNFGKVWGVLFDLGVSSYQLENKERGFSFKREGNLDMRMDKSLTISALDIVNSGSLDQLTRIFMKFGEEPLAKPIALTITKKRNHNQITKTGELANLVSEVYRRFGKTGKIQPATKVFQALRIAVNNELEALKTGLLQGVKLLEEGGRLVVISYHSLEDRITKLTFKKLEKEGIFKILTKKPVTPTFEEIRQNNRARSAKLRAIEKL